MFYKKIYYFKKNLKLLLPLIVIFFTYTFMQLGYINIRYEIKGGIFMNNNKSHMKTDKKTNAELRKMFPQSGSDIGIENGSKIDANNDKFTKRSKLSHNK